MNFSDEEYVRLYVSDTATWNLLEWEGQALLALALRKFDKAGVFDFGRHAPEKALFASVKMPIEIIRIGLQRLFEEEVWVLQEGRIFWPKYIEAQTCRRSDKLRQRMSRAAAKRDVNVTACDNRDVASQNVTGCHESNIECDTGHEMSLQARRGEARRGSGSSVSVAGHPAKKFESSFADPTKAPESIEFDAWSVEFCDRHKIDLKEEWESCRDYRKSRGETREDWNAEFRSWLKKARDFKPKTEDAKPAKRGIDAKSAGLPGY